MVGICSCFIWHYVKNWKKKNSLLFQKMTQQKATPLIILEWHHYTPAFVPDIWGDPCMGVNFDNLITSPSVVMPKHLHVEILILSRIIFLLISFAIYSYSIISTLYWLKNKCVGSLYYLLILFNRVKAML